MLKKTVKNYISDIDIHLAQFDKDRPKSFAEKAEIEKYNRISALRDNPEPTSQEEKDLFDFQ